MYMQLAKSLMDSQVSRQLVFGQKLSPADALKLKVVTNIYTDVAELKAQVEKFA